MCRSRRTELTIVTDSESGTCYPVLLWSAWSRPVDALARLAVGPPGPDGALQWGRFLRDLVDASGTVGVLIVLLYARGATIAGASGLLLRARPGLGFPGFTDGREARPGASLAPPRRGGGY